MSLFLFSDYINDIATQHGNILPGELEKDLFQLLIVTVGGTIIAWLFQKLRDKAARLEIEREIIRNLLKSIDELYRTSKQIKRELRVHSLSGTERRERVTLEGSVVCEDLPITEYAVAGEFALQKFDELSRLQLSLEQTKKLTRVRTDIFSEDRRRRISRYLGYCEKYFHNVVDDFEKRRIFVNSGDYIIDLSCGRSFDFLGPRLIPYDDIDSISKRGSLEESYKAINDLIKKTEIDFGHSKKYTKSIADECFWLALEELGEELIVRNRPAPAWRRALGILSKGRRSLPNVEDDGASVDSAQGQEREI